MRSAFFRRTARFLTLSLPRLCPIDLNTRSGSASSQALSLGMWFRINSVKKHSPTELYLLGSFRHSVEVASRTVNLHEHSRFKALIQYHRTVCNGRRVACESCSGDC